MPETDLVKNFNFRNNISKLKATDIINLIFDRYIAYIVILISILIVQLSAATVFSTSNYWIKVRPTVIGPYSVLVDIQTNIPGSVSLGANLELMGLKSSDTFIGTQFTKVSINNGKGSTVIDANLKNTMPGRKGGFKLPSGSYNVVVSFHPLWHENKQFAKENNIEKNIEGKATVKLTASGEASKNTKKMLEGQRWLMENVVPGDKWDPVFLEKKFGPYLELEYLGDFNPRIIKLYYFKSIDITITVNVHKMIIDTWDIGINYK